MTTSVPPTPRERFEACLVAGAVGDALGAEVEFLSWPEIRRRHGDDGITDLAARAQFTDDTQMTLFTAEGLIRTSVRLRGKGVTTHIDVGWQALLRWLQTQGGSAEHASGWLISNDVLHRRRAPGNTCLSSLQSGRLGTVDDPINDSKGCGAVMRMAPVGLWFAGEVELAWEVGRDLGAITHGHREGYDSAGAFAVIVSAVAAGAPLMAAIGSAIELASADGGSLTTQLLQEATSFAGIGALGPEELCDRLGEGWVGEEALALAVGCCLAHGDPLAALLAAVNHRGDSDSTGAIAGNLLGLLHGTDWMLDGWLDRIEGADLVRTVAADLWTERHDPPMMKHGTPTAAWFDRYPSF